MGKKAIQTPLPADLPEDWTLDQIISPNGTESGEDERHGYNYQAKQINAAQRGVNALVVAVAGKAEEHHASSHRTGGTDPLTAADVGADAAGSAAAVDAKLVAHAGDTTKHIEAAERTAWNAKETTTGAQVKADAAEARAKAASRPSTWVPGWTDVTGKPASFTPSGHTHPWSQVTGQPGTYPPSAHTQGWDTISGKPTTFPPTGHGHGVGEISGAAPIWSPVFGGAPQGPISAGDYGTPRLRNISAGTGDLTPGASPLNSGEIYLMYE